MYDKLFSPIKLRELELPNRVIMPPMGTNFVSDDCMVTPQLIAYHVARAKGGVGLNFVEISSINKDSAPRKKLSIAEDKFIPGHKMLVEAIHAAGGRCGVQLWLGGPGVASDPNCRVWLPNKDTGHEGLRLSPNAKRDENGVIPAATIDEIHMLVNDFAQAARRSVEAGYDIIEFHCGHNYFPHMMLSKGFNFRADEYGGTPENRMRFPLECIRAIRANIPDTMPLSIRISAFDEPELNNGQGGNSIEDNIEFLKQAKLAGVDIVNVSRGNIQGTGTRFEVPPVNLKPGFNVESAAKIRKETGLITMAVGRINKPGLAEQIIEDGKADLVVMGRAQIADPDFCNKAKAGKADEIRYCIGCDQGCYDHNADPALPPITCLRNPFVGREATMPVVKTKAAKKVLVVGGGMGGMECALYLNQRGHNVVIIDKADHLGGQFILAGASPHKREFVDAVEDEKRFVENAGIPVMLNTIFSEELLVDLSPDEVVIATGAGPLLIPLPGANLPNVSNAHAVLSGKTLPLGKTAIIGGGIVGVELAEYLTAKGIECCIIEMKPAIASDLGGLRRMFAISDLAEAGIECITNAACKEITEHSVKYEQSGESFELKCDSVVLAAGARSLPHADISEACDRHQIPWHLVGDAIQARRALNAIAEGVEIALQI